MREEESDEEVLEVEKSNQSGGISGNPIIVYLVYFYERASFMPNWYSLAIDFKLRICYSVTSSTRMVKYIRIIHQKGR